VFSCSLICKCLFSSGKDVARQDCIRIDSVVCNLQVTEDNAEQNGVDEGEEEPIVVDADSNDGAVLVNGNEAEEEWGTKNDGTPSA